jgi:thiosulfate reductase cytochrome b subunit
VHDTASPCATVSQDVADSAYFPAVAAPDSVSEAPRHSALVRVTHWTTALSFLGLLVSGIAILLAHPRLYWGETGAVGTPSLIDLPLPFMLTGQSGWGRSLHFFAAWISVLTGLLYVVHGMVTRHFRRHLLPATVDLTWRAIARVVSSHMRMRPPGGEDALGYNVLQRLTYLGVVFVLFPLMIWTGLAMSPAITSVVPALVDVLGGQQSARTIHFLVASALVVFLVVHVAMVCLAGFGVRMRTMITGSGTRNEASSQTAG